MKKILHVASQSYYIHNTTPAWHNNKNKYTALRKGGFFRCKLLHLRYLTAKQISGIGFSMGLGSPNIETKIKSSAFGTQGMTCAATHQPSD